MVRASSLWGAKRQRSKDKENHMKRSKFGDRRLFVSAIATFALLVSGRTFANGDDGPGPKLIHTESVGQIAISYFAFGGPSGCNASTGTDCTFYDLKGTITGSSVPFGPYSGAITATVLSSSKTPAGGHDTNGNPTAFCSPEAGTEVDTFSDGSTLSSDFQGLSCCAATGTATDLCPAGTPSVNHDSSVIIGGTGKFKGASGGTAWSDNNNGSAPLTLHAEGVLLIPGSSH
jgi:hypothetical protein